MSAHLNRICSIASGLILSCAAVLAGPAQAALVAQDLDAAGDGKVTLDTATNLRWLDLNLSRPWAINSANVYTAAGWQVASFDQVKMLIGDHFGVIPFADGSRHTVDAASAQSFIDLLGVTYTETSGMSWGRFQSDTAGRAGQVIVRQDGLVSYLIAGDAFADSDPNSFSGVFYVTAVPEPEAYAMLLAGLGLMGVIARRRRI